jgi:hypothetical protein
MRLMNQPLPRPAILAIMALILGASPAGAAVVFSHTFNEGAGNLNGTAVDVGTGNWVAANVVTANGVFSTGPGSATLSFSPAQNTQYQLDARITGVTGDGNWVALGFANGQSTASNNNDRFITGNVVGTAWMLFRGNNDPNPNTTFLGNGTLGTGNHGLTSPANWSELNNNGGDIDLRILLDTSGGSGNWEVTWFAKLTADSSYTTVRPAEGALIEANFTSVGFAFSATATDGVIQSFSLTEVPEPSVALLGGLGILALLRRRR